jgi:hypothetical protein
MRLLPLLLAAASAQSTFRPPSVPLFVTTPFVSIWSNTAENLAAQTSFWLGTPNTLNSIVRVDGKAYQVLGQPAGVAPAKQNGFPVVTATSSYYTFTAGGVQVNLRFTSPELTDDLDVLTRQASYLTWTVSSLDGAAHSVQVYYDQSAEVITNNGTQMIEWDRPAVAPGIVALRLGQVGQKEGNFNYTQRLLASTEPHQQQDYGFVYAMTEVSTSTVTVSSVITTTSKAQAAFTTSGSLPGPSGDAAPPAQVNANGNTVSALAWDLGTVQPNTNASCRVTFFVDEVVSILYYGTQLAPYWRRNYSVGDATTVPAVPLVAAVTQADQVLAAAAAFDSEIAQKLTASAGQNLSLVAQLTYRQVAGANGYAWNGSSIWAFQKEISSDGDMSTLDVIFPSAPQHIFLSGGEPLRMLLENPFFIMAGLSPVHFDQECALHSLGKWPTVDPGNGGCGMPMESTGDALLMAAAVTMAKNDSAWVQPYMPTLRRFATYCAQSLPFPAPQDMTDDFSHAPGNLTNLAIKCILGIGAQGYLEASSGNTTGAQAQFAIAQSFGAGFAELGFIETDPAPHFKFIYNNTPAIWDTSYGLMYNAAWARMLGLEWLVPNFYPLFTQHFDFLATVTVNATWCPALSSIEHDSKWDWLVHTASLMYSNSSQPTSWSTGVFDQLFFFANTTSSKFPLTDHPECTGPFPPVAAADRARPVLGAFFFPLLITHPSAELQASRQFVKDFALQHLGVDTIAVAGLPPAG